MRNNILQNQAELRGSDWLPRLASVRYLTVLMVAIGYASTMAVGPHAAEFFSHLGYDPSWIGVQILFFFSGALALRSLQKNHVGLDYLRPRIAHVAPLFILITTLTVGLIYPLFGTASAAGFADLARYFFLTVSCLDPGRELPGLLDSAPYACLIQGAAWTLRWGLLLHIGCAVLGRFDALRRPPVIVIGAVATTASYIGVTFLAVKYDWQVVGPLVTALRLCYPFVIGMAVWAYRDQLPRRLPLRAGVLLLFINFAMMKYNFGPWSPLIEVSLCLFWGYGAWLLASSRGRSLRMLDNWPRLAVGVYLLNWPVAQIVLMVAPTLSPLSLVLVSVPLSMGIGAVMQYALSGQLSVTERRLVRPALD